MKGSDRIVVASASQTRHEMLKRAGLAFTVDPADIDEAAIRETLRTDDVAVSPSDIAEVLARTKGETVSVRQPDAVVIAADQVLALGDEIFAKPAGVDEARETLMRLRGQTHQLHSAVVLAQAGEVTWIQVETAHLTMRKFSAGFISDYLMRAGADVCQSVGAYQLEGLGIQLFEKIEGDYFTILGLPLVPLLAELRQRGVIEK